MLGLSVGSTVLTPQIKGALSYQKGALECAKGSTPDVPSQRQCHYERSFFASLRTLAIGNSQSKKRANAAEWFFASPTNDTPTPFGSSWGSWDVR